MEWSEFQRKLNRWHALTQESWWLRYSGEPLLFKLLWKLKIQARPPHFANPFLFALASGTFFGLAMLLLARSPEHMIVTGYAGCAYGVIIAIWFWVEARLRKLPKWEDL